MKNLFKFMIFGLLAFSRVEGCSDCVKILCEVMLEYESRCDPNYVCKTPGVQEYLTYDRGMIAGLRCAIANIEKIHPGAQLTLYEFEKIMNKKLTGKD